MGLTIHYQLRAPAGMSDAAIPGLVTRMHAAAKSLQRTGRVEAVSGITRHPADLHWLAEWLQVPVSGMENCTRGVEVPAVDGRIFTVTLGQDCEPLRLGLCRYPDRVPDHQTGRTRAVRRRGWRLSGFCKTQYASLHGWENFRRCHTAAIDLLISLRLLGLEVSISDEGAYWPDRDESALRQSVDRMNGIVAAFAGAMKDTVDEEGGSPVQSPIFAHPQFERIEAVGLNRHAAQIRQAQAVVRQLGPKLFNSRSPDPL
jgi:hypothetical protein